MDVFVYGTLTDADRVAGLLSEFSFRGDATLHGLHRVEGVYPTLAPGGRVDGRILRTPEIARLDAYEGVDRGLYVRVPVPLADGDSATVYVGDPASLNVADPVRWPGDGPLADRVAEFVAENGVILRIRE